MISDPTQARVVELWPGVSLVGLHESPRRHPDRVQCPLTIHAVLMIGPSLINSEQREWLNSALTDPGSWDGRGWVTVDKQSMRHTFFDTVCAVGDVAEESRAKSGDVATESVISRTPSATD